MATEVDKLKANLGRWTLLLGVLQITVGCMVGFILPSAVAWFRGIVMAHIEFTANGVLMVAFGFLVKELRLSPRRTAKSKTKGSGPCFRPAIARKTRSWLAEKWTRPRLCSSPGLSPTALKAWFATLQIGTWTNGAAGLVAAFIGSSSKLMPTLNEKFPPPHGVDSLVVTSLLQLCGITIMVALLLTIFGLLRPKVSVKDAIA